MAEEHGRLGSTSIIDVFHNPRDIPEVIRKVVPETDFTVAPHRANNIFPLWASVFTVVFTDIHRAIVYNTVYF